MRALLWFGVGLGAIYVIGQPSFSNALAGPIIHGAFERHFSGKATVALPLEVGNRSWYSNWIMLLDPNIHDTPFVQIGLIREHASQSKPCAFIAYAMPGRALVYENLGEVTPRTHVVEISGDRRTLHLEFDGRLVKLFDRSQFFEVGTKPFYQFATEVHGLGDRASGFIENIKALDDASRVTKLDQGGTWKDRGVRLDGLKNRYRASGVFDA